jgi:hypothetical protein
LTKLYRLQETSGADLTTLPKLAFLFSPETVSNLNFSLQVTNF